MGVEDPDSIMVQIANYLKGSVSPDVLPFVNIDVSNMEGKDVILIHVSTGTSRPYYLRDNGLKSSGVYVRKGSSFQPVREEGIREMILENSGRSYKELR